MSDKKSERLNPDAAERPGEPARGLKTVKVTLHLSVETAQRLGVESVMRRVSQSTIAEEVLSAYLSRWKLPTEGEGSRRDAG